MVMVGVMASRIPRDATSITRGERVRSLMWTYRPRVQGQTNRPGQQTRQAPAQVQVGAGRAGQQEARISPRSRRRDNPRRPRRPPRRDRKPPSAHTDHPGGENGYAQSDGRTQDEVQVFVEGQGQPNAAPGGGQDPFSGPAVVGLRRAMNRGLGAAYKAQAAAPAATAARMMFR